MIKEANDNDIQIINTFLNEFNQKGIESIDSNPFNKFILYYENNVPVGFMQFSIIYDRIELDYIFVLDNFRKKGIASMLMTYLDKQLLSNNITNISLEVAKNNKSAINLYRKFGFKEVAVRNNYYNGVDGLLFIKEVK